MTPEEADALFLSGLPGPAAELGLGTVMTAARLKVLAALPSELRARASRLVERFHLDAAGWFRSSDSVPHLPALSQGVWDARRMRIGYRRGEQVVDRVVDPLGVVLKAGAWYLVAMADGQTRTYRASRVTAVELLDESFERPPGFDLAAYWADTTAAYERGVPRVEVRALVRHDRVGQLYDAVGEASTVTIGDAADGGAPAGWLPVTMTLDWPEEVAGRLLAMGADLEVIEPVDLRRRITGVAAAVAELYA
jgi:predicted DNA-binding transcriptional regulator YafY